MGRATFSYSTSTDLATVVLRGDWCARTLGGAANSLSELLNNATNVSLDLREVGRFDTAGAYAVVTAARRQRSPGVIHAAPATLESIARVTRALEVIADPDNAFRPNRFALLAVIGRGIVEFTVEIYQSLVFVGRLLRSLCRAVINPQRLRLAPTSALVGRAGLSAAWIIAVTSFFIGTVIAFLGANLLRDFGAEGYTVELIALTMFREFNILITAIIIAGRSSSSFAAEIGAMKMNQEIDAMVVMGVDPYDALVLPRFLSLLLTITILTFIATVAGLAGGLLSTWLSLGYSPSFFFDRVLNNVDARHYWVGLSKAPIMAMIIAAIGCRQGLSVGIGIEALGRRVTTSVVHAIFAIIMIDAAAALLFMELDL